MNKYSRLFLTELVPFSREQKVSNEIPGTEQGKSGIPAAKFTDILDDFWRQYFDTTIKVFFLKYGAKSWNIKDGGPTSFSATPIKWDSVNSQKWMTVSRVIPYINKSTGLPEDIEPIRKLSVNMIATLNGHLMKNGADKTASSGTLDFREKWGDNLAYFNWLTSVDIQESPHALLYMRVEMFIQQSGVNRVKKVILRIRTGWNEHI